MKKIEDKCKILSIGISEGVMLRCEEYFAGHEIMLPEQHFSMYGAGFLSLPTELQNQVNAHYELIPKRRVLA